MAGPYVFWVLVGNMVASGGPGANYDSDEEAAFDREPDFSMDNVIVVDNLPVLGSPSFMTRHLVCGCAFVKFCCVCRSCLKTRLTS